MKIIASLLLIVTIAVIGSCEYFYSLEQPKSHFTDFKGLEKSGLIERGWVPSFIPQSAYDIHEQHDLDTNWVQMSFKFNPKDTSTMVNSCSVTKEKESTIYLCKNMGSKIKIITKDGYAKYSSTSI